MDEYTKFQIYLISSYLARLISNKFGNKVLMECFDQADGLFDEEHLHLKNDDC